MLSADALERLVHLAWQRAASTPGFMGETEVRALTMLAASADREGALVEIGSFKGRSTLALATVTRELGGGPVISIDPHDSPAVTDPGEHSYAAFRAALRQSGLEAEVEVHRATARAVAADWRRPVRMLWIDGDHTWDGARADLELYTPWLSDGALVTLHDTLHFFEGPIRVFVERILGSDAYGPAGFLHSIGWAQYRPRDGERFRRRRRRLAAQAAHVLARVSPPYQNRGWSKLRHKLSLARVPHRVPSAAAWLRTAGRELQNGDPEGGVQAAP